MSGIRSLNGLNSNTIYINTISSGSAIDITSSSNTASTINVDISKQSANTTIADTDLFLLEDSSGNIRKITGANMKSELEQSTVVSPLLLTGNAISIKGLSGFTANKFLKVNSAGDSIEYADDNDTNFWTYSSPSLRPDNIADNILLGTSSNSNSRKLIVVGDTELQDLYLPTDKKIISVNNSSDYLQFGNGTLTNNYGSNLISNTLVMGSSADIVLAGGQGISRAASSTDKIIFNSGNTTFGNTGIFNNSIQVKSTTSSNSGNVSFFEASVNGTNNIDLHAPYITTHDYNVYLPKITNTSIIDVYILSNQNIVAGTNVSISGTETITINSTDTNTQYTGGTNITLAGTTFNLDTTLVGNLTWTGSQTYQNTLEITGPASSLGYINLYSNDDNKISLKTNVNIGSSYDIILPSSTGTLALTTQIPNLSFDSPLQISSNTVSLGGLSSYGSTNQIIATANDGSNNLQYRTLTAGTNIGIVHSSSAITISGPTVYWENANTVGVLDIQPVNTVNDIDLDAINLLVIPKTVNVIPTGLSSGKVIQYDSGLGGGNGSMVFGDNGSSASVNWDTGIYAKQFINMKCGTDTLLQLNNTPASVASATFTLNDINIDLGTNNGYSNLAYENCEPLFLFNKASSGTTHSHLVMKRDLSQTDFIILRQNDSDELLIHFENKGDRFEVNKNWEYGHAYAKWSYDNSSYTYFRNPSGTNSASSFAGSYFAFHNNGSVIFLNTPSAGTSAGDYIGFSTGGVAKGRMSMDGNFKITGTITESHTFCDERVKENIKDYDTNAIELLNKLKIKSFNRKTFDNLKASEDGILLPFSQRFSDKSYYDIGLIAQDILTEVPELSFLVENQDGGDIEPMSIPSWKPLTAICIKAIQQQQEQINILTDLVNTMKITIDKLNNSSTFKSFKS